MLTTLVNKNVRLSSVCVYKTQKNLCVCQSLIMFKKKTAISRIKQ